MPRLKNSLVEQSRVLASLKRSRNFCLFHSFIISSISIQDNIPPLYPQFEILMKPSFIGILIHDDSFRHQLTLQLIVCWWFQLSIPHELLKLKFKLSSTLQILMEYINSLAVPGCTVKSLTVLGNCQFIGSPWQLSTDWQSPGTVNSLAVLENCH